MHVRNGKQQSLSVSRHVCSLTSCHTFPEKFTLDAHMLQYIMYVSRKICVRKITALAHSPTPPHCNCTHVHKHSGHPCRCRRILLLYYINNTYLFVDPRLQEVESRFFFPVSKNENLYVSFSLFGW